MKSRIDYTLIATLLTVAIMTSCSGNGRMEYRRASGSTWGTTYNITYNADHDLTDSITAVMKQIDASLSPFCKGSIVDRINKGEDVAPDSMFITVFNTSQEVSRLSGGMFDPTVAPLINLWGFGYKEGAKEPTEQEVAEALRLVGIDSFIIVVSKLIKKNAATEFNFSAIAKGYGCDCVAAMLRRNGCTDYLVEIGGEIAVAGVNSRGEKWHVQIDAPVEGIKHQQAALAEVTDCGVATSGNYRNFRNTKELGKVGHTISPKTGMPVKTELLGVTVIAPDCMWADALATSCMAMPLTEAQQMIMSLKDKGVSALFITEGDKVTTTPGFPLMR